LETAWFLVLRYGLVQDINRVVMGALVLGFPLAVVLAWTYDLTPGGIVRTPDDGGPEGPQAAASGRPRRSAWLAFCAVSVAFGLVLRWFRP